MWKNLKTNGFMYFAILVLILTIWMCGTAEAITGTEQKEAQLVEQFNTHIKEFSLTVTGDQYEMFDQLMDEVGVLDNLRIDKAYQLGITDILEHLVKSGYLTDQELSQYAAELQVINE